MEAKLTKICVLKKILEFFRIALVKNVPKDKDGSTIWELAWGEGALGHPLEVHACSWSGSVFRPVVIGSRTKFLAMFMDDIRSLVFSSMPAGYIGYSTSCIGCSLRQRSQDPVRDVENPFLGCKSLEEVMVKLDLVAHGERTAVMEHERWKKRAER